ncbi:MAG: DUF5698 domain-containing protein [Candidatus Marinimicrobia bacterium]|jgi:uncharacterized protein YebE (UPF0316 family)|nr:DUF5698 domain-containing protein [Candidatus Neomarinimicrobiota bacterium]MDD4960904.1 DUF5698 domain-containing protein [Candidatus Neomarinimicrobiota bacterium]MDD5709617.1 DUF5698 domain-containing protein [Candidatus Neomarinimicrobiota bacterium]MDX9777364.1 DUF5698 domain-containing protein [bacterium]
MFTLESIQLLLIIFFARVCDVSLGTLRHVMVIKEKRLPAVVFSFVEALIWVYAVSRVLSELSSPMTIIAFALGFACGTFVGMSIDRLFKIGDQVLRIFTVNGAVIATHLRDLGYRVTEIEGKGRDGRIDLLFVQLKRKKTAAVTREIRRLDPACYFVIDDIRVANVAIPAVRK